MNKKLFFDEIEKNSFSILINNQPVSVVPTSKVSEIYEKCKFHKILGQNIRRYSTILFYKNGGVRISGLNTVMLADKTYEQVCSWISKYGYVPKPKKALTPGSILVRVEIWDNEADNTQLYADMFVCEHKNAKR